jgi:hypothetical protein
MFKGLAEVSVLGYDFEPCREVERSQVGLKKTWLRGLTDWQAGL